MHRPVDFREFLESLPLVPWEGEAPSGCVTYVGPQAENFSGYSVEQWMHPLFWDGCIFPDDQVMVRESRAGLCSGGVAKAIDYRMERAGGDVIWVREIVKLVTASDGRVSIRGALTDITAIKRSDVSLWKSEERMRALVQDAPDAMVLTDLAGVIINLNGQAEALLGYSPSDVVGSSMDHLVPDRLRARLPELREAFERDPERRSLVDGHGFAVVDRSGVEIPVELSMSAVLTDLDRPRLLCSFRNMTARLRVEAQLRSSERRLREIANVLPAMVCFVDTQNRYRFVNDAYARLHGQEQQRMEGRLVREVIGESLFAQMRSAIEAALAGRASHFRGEAVDPAEGRIPVDVSLLPQHDDQGLVSGYFLIIFDVSEEVSAREADRRHLAELAHVTRVATMGELTASLAHELNQPLTSIVSNAGAASDLLSREPPEVVNAQEALKDILDDGNRASEVIASMSQLLRAGETEREVVELLDLVQSVVGLLRSEAAGRGVELEVREAEGTPTVCANVIELKQVLLNLIVNGMEAASKRDRPRVLVETRLEAGEVEIAVSDNGPGLPSSGAEELFTPFVSHTPEGLGMGLTISRTIVEAHGGKIWGEEKEPAGAVFRVRLPLP
jgi:PAS domain S-box-containing protein